MIHFECDYLEGCHPAILQRLQKTNLEQTTGYGTDPHCARAAELIRNACEAPDADVHFLVGGTQTNATVISALLRPHQGVLCAATGHINAHETGAIEHGGHKVLPLPSGDGRITAAQIQEAVQAHFSDGNHEHVVQPGMVYISFPGDEKSSGGCVAAGRGFFHINSHGGAEPCPFSPYSDINVRDTSLQAAMKSPLFLALQEEGVLMEEHPGGCVLHEKRTQVESLLNNR